MNINSISSMNGIPYLMLLVISVLLGVAISHKKCESFKNIDLNTKTRGGSEINITSFSGVMERRSFENLTMVEIFVRQQNVTDIRAECVRHLVRLNTLVFWGCPIKSISSGAFRNVDTLKNLQIAYGNLTIVPDGVFGSIHNLEVLRLHNNGIHTIEDGAFANLSGLKKFFIGDNKLKVFDNSWFLYSTNIEIMDFQRNSIEKIPHRAFFGMQKLKQLFLDNNEISSIESDAFLTIRKLEYLGLRYNRLKDLNADVFPDKLSVRSLLIDANYLNYLSNEVLRKLSVKDLTLDGNPWKCPCLDRIHYWVYTKNVTLRSSSYCKNPNIPICFYPQTYSTTCLENIDEEMTKNYIEMLKNMNVDPNCARLQ